MFIPFITIGVIGGILLVLLKLSSTSSPPSSTTPDEDVATPTPSSTVTTPQTSDANSQGWLVPLFFMVVLIIGGIFLWNSGMFSDSPRLKISVEEQKSTLTSYKTLDGYTYFRIPKELRGRRYLLKMPPEIKVTKSFGGEEFPPNDAVIIPDGEIVALRLEPPPSGRVQAVVIK